MSLWSKGGLLFGLLALMGAAEESRKSEDEVINLPRMEVKGLPVTSYGIGIAGSRDPVTKKVRRLFVSEVVYGTPAARFGLKEQDEILAINGVRVTEFEGLMQPGSALFDLLVNRPSNEQITLELLTRRPVTVTLKSQNFSTITLAPKHSHPPYFISVSIARSPAEVYEFAADPKNLPKWVSGLSDSIKSIGGDWVAESPMGRVRIRFMEKNKLGVLDHEVTLPSGETVYYPLRVQPNGSGSEVVFTLYRLALVSTEDFEKEASRVRHDLARLKELLEK